MVTIQSRAVSDKNRITFATGQDTIAAAGTGENMAAQVIPDGYQIVIKAMSTNTGSILIGNSKANSESATTAFKLKPNESISLMISNMNLLWINSTVNAEGVEWIVET